MAHDIVDIQRYAPLAQRVITASQVLADTLGHAEVTPDHLALALHVMAPDALAAAGVDRDAWKREAAERLRGVPLGERAALSADLSRFLSGLAREATVEVSVGPLIAGVVDLRTRRAPTKLGPRAGVLLREHLAVQSRARTFRATGHDGEGVLREIEAVFAEEPTPGLLVDRCGAVLLIRRTSLEIRIAWHAAAGVFELSRRGPGGPSAPMNIPFGRGEADPAEPLVEVLVEALR